MYTCAVRPEIASLSAYVPGMSIAEVRERYGLSRVIKIDQQRKPAGGIAAGTKGARHQSGRGLPLSAGRQSRAAGKPWPVRTMSPRSASSSATALTRSSTC